MSQIEGNGSPDSEQARSSAPLVLVDDVLVVGRTAGLGRTEPAHGSRGRGGSSGLATHRTWSATAVIQELEAPEPALPATRPPMPVASALTKIELLQVLAVDRG